MSMVPEQLAPDVIGGESRLSEKIVLRQ